MLATGFPTLRDANPPWHLTPGRAAQAARSQNGLRTGPEMAWGLAPLGPGKEATVRPKKAGSRWGFGSWGSLGRDEAMILF